MIMKQTGQPGPSLDKRQRILHAAEALFAEKGYENATIQEIATAAGVGDGTVYDYFKNKEDVLFNTLKDGFHPSAHRKGFQEHLIDPESHHGQLTPLSRLEHFIRRQFQLALTQPSFAKIFIINGIYNKKFYASDAFQDFDRYMETLSHIINDGKQEKTFRATITPEAVRLLVLGAFSHLTLRWLISDKKTNIDKAGEINAMTELVIRSVSVG
jgi:TetR/AcrR family fatty acid metabolism transcriptional regulator